MSAASTLSAGIEATPGFWAHESTSHHSVPSIWGQYSSDRGTKFFPPGYDSIDIPRTNSPSILSTWHAKSSSRYILLMTESLQSALTPAYVANSSNRSV